MITVNEKEHVFHLHNGRISYLLYVMDSGQLGHLYFGKALRTDGSYLHMVEKAHRPMTTYITEGDLYTSYEHLRQEYPVYGTSDYRYPALEVQGRDGSAICKPEYYSYVIFPGKKSLEGLPATYVEDDSEAETLEIRMRDEWRGLEVTLSYTIFRDCDAIARSVRFVNQGEDPLFLDRAMSLSLDYPDADWESVQLSGSWARERSVITKKLEPGVTAVSSMRGNSSHQHNPFLALKRKDATEHAGEVCGFSLVYSGNFLAQAEVDNYHVLRVMLGINPFGFRWKLEPGESFVTPEAVMVWSCEGMNGMSRQFHTLYRNRLARGYWRDRERPVLINNWEATAFDYVEEDLIRFARKAKECGIELFVLDDGWFGARNNDRAGLGDWRANPAKLPGGIKGLTDQIETLGMKFGLWFEPEMVNRDSDLFRAHPDYIIQTPGRTPSHGRNQFVLDFSRKEVVDEIYGQMHTLLSQAKISYIKWDEPDGSRALVTVTRILSEINGPYRRIPLLGLNPNRKYRIYSRYLSYEAYGDELMQFGLMLEDQASGQIIEGSGGSGSCEDFRSLVYEVLAI